MTHLANPHHFPRRIVCLTDETTETLYLLGEQDRIVGKQDEGFQLIASLQYGLDAIRNSASRFPHRPRVYFEEWNDPLISGIPWVEELIQIAGGDPIFPELQKCGKAKDRIVHPAAVIERNPEIVLASWCGMKVKKEQIVARDGWGRINAVQRGHIYEIPGTCILQPGPASLTDGVRQLHAVLAHVMGVEVPAELKPAEPFETLETTLL